MEKRENPLARKGADVAKWIKAVDCESTMRGFNSRRSPIRDRYSFTNNKDRIGRETGHPQRVREGSQD